MSYTFDTNGLWLEITNSDLSSGVAFLNLHAATNLWGATNEIYGIFSTTNLLSTAWPVETEVWQATNYSVVPFTVPTQNRTNLFLRAQDSTGMLDGFGVPVWWDWLYLGSTSLASTNLDFSGSGTTFAQDFTNSVTPVVYNYTGITATNSIFNFSPVPVTLAVTGWPYFAIKYIFTDPLEVNLLSGPDFREFIAFAPAMEPGIEESGAGAGGGGGQSRNWKAESREARDCVPGRKGDWRFKISGFEIGSKLRRSGFRPYRPLNLSGATFPGPALARLALTQAVTWQAFSLWGR